MTNGPEPTKEEEKILPFGCADYVRIPTSIAMAFSLGCVLYVWNGFSKSFNRLNPNDCSIWHLKDCPRFVPDGTRLSDIFGGEKSCLDYHSGISYTNWVGPEAYLLMAFIIVMVVLAIITWLLLPYGKYHPRNSLYHIVLHACMIFVFIGTVLILASSAEKTTSDGRLQSVRFSDAAKVKLSKARDAGIDAWSIAGGISVYYTDERVLRDQAGELFRADMMSGKREMWYLHGSTACHAYYDRAISKRGIDFSIEHEFRFYIIFIFTSILYGVCMTIYCVFLIIPPPVLKRRAVEDEEEYWD